MNVSDHTSVVVWNPHVYDGWGLGVVLTCQVCVCDTLQKTTVLQLYN